MSPRALGVAALVSAVAIAPSRARADTCGPTDGIGYALPLDGSPEVHPATRVVVRYTLEAALAADVPAVQIVGPVGAVEAAVSWDGREIVVTPSEPLARGARFTASASRPDAAAWTWSFETTSSEVPPAAPVLGPELEVRAEYLGGGPEGDDRCGPLGLERYRVHLELPAAQGSSGLGNVEYLAFQTRGHGITEPTEVGRAVDDSSAEDVGFDLYLRADGVDGQACFRVLALDVTGAASGTTEEACTRLEEGPFFQSLCGATPGRPSRAGTAMELVLAVLWLWVRARACPRSDP